jgi:adenylate cyclase
VIRTVSIVIALLAAGVAGVSALPPVQAIISGPSIDIALWLRHRARAEPPPRPNHAVVIAIDEASYRSQALGELPNVAWGPEFAQVIDRALSGGAAAVGLDVILPTSIERFAPNHDRPLRQTLARARRDGDRVVLAQVQVQDQPLLPHPSLVRVVGPDNVRWATADADPDGIVRRVPLWIERSDGRFDPSLALDLAGRSIGAPPQRGDGITRLGERTLAGDSVLLDLRGGGHDVPTYSFVDILGCEDADYLARAFAGKTVLIGLVLDVEDRKLTSKRWLTQREGLDRPAACTGIALPPAQSVRPDIAGVFLHAVAVETMLGGTAPTPASPTLALASHAGVVALTATAVVALPALASLAAIVALSVAIASATATVAGTGVLLPVVGLFAALLLAAIVAAGLRIVVVDGDKRRMRRMFDRYLSQTFVDRLVESGQMPELGGERREMSILFTDLEGFTGLIEAVDPLDAMPVLLEYLTGIADCVMANGGYVNEFIGDAVLAFFGAPVEGVDHRRQALAAARAIDAFAEQFRKDHQIGGRSLGATRVGVHSGITVVGNFGSRQRLKYSAMGDTVNTASRLEALNKQFGTRLLVSAATLAGTDEANVRPLARAIMKGRREALTVFELLPIGGAAGAYDWTRRWLALDRGERGQAAALKATYPSDPVSALLANGTTITLTEK